MAQQSGSIDPYEFPRTLSEFALIPHLDERLRELAELAEPEDWDYKHTHTEYKFPILRNYLRYTYSRLREEGKVAVSADEQAACFNTGLVTENQEDIYALFVENKLSDRRSFWHFRSFARSGEHDLGRFSDLPEMAHYFDDPTELVFDTRKELRWNAEHIVAENKERFPEPYRSMNNYQVQNFLKGAIDSAKQRVRRNYKTAIPQYYQRQIQLLLPLCIEAPSKADLALVAANYGDFYRASTCLTLDMAYNNARQLARPDRDWLQP